MTPHEALKAARALIADERNWIKGEYDREVEGRTCYCADGALMFATDGVGVPLEGEGNWFAYEGARRALAAHAPRTAHGVINFNDAPDTTHADVLAMFDKAIEATAP